MKEIVINVDSCNSESIKTIQGNNNAEFYKIYLLENERRLSLVGKTVKFGYVMNGTTKGDIIEDLNISNAEQGEITFPITNKISKKDGVYTCQLAIYGADEFLEYTATFGLTVQANIFTKIAGEIADTKDLTYIESILEEAKTVSRDLKTNIPVATNLNSSLESNISNARNINTTLADTTEKSKVTTTDAIEKKSQLENSITKAKEFIEGLDGSQNIPQLRLDVTELQNGLKSNQALSYEGSSIAAENTLEGRTEVMKITGRTLYNIQRKQVYSLGTNLSSDCYTSKQSENLIDITLNKIEDGKYYFINIGGIDFKLLKPNTKYTVICEEVTNGLSIQIMSTGHNNQLSDVGTFKDNKTTITTNDLSIGDKGQILYIMFPYNKLGNYKVRNLMLVEGEIDCIGNYFEGLKSFGEAESEGDKYKISILSGNDPNTPYNNFSIEKGVYYFYSNGNRDVTNEYDTYSIKDIDNVYKFSYNSTVEQHLTLWKNNKYVVGFLYKKDSIFSKIKNIDYDEIRITSLKTDATQVFISKQDIKDILIKEPLRSVSDVQDIMFEEESKVKIARYIDDYTFTGDETMRDTTEQDEKSGTGEYKVFALTVNKTIDINKNINNNFPKKTFSVAFQNMDSEGLAVTQYGIYIKILKSKLSTQDTEGLKAWLKANTTTIYFARATPVTEVVENCIDIDLDTYQEKSYFNILNSLPGTLDFKVPSNLGSVVQNMAKEVNNIWDVINNLLVPSIVKANGNLAMLKLNNNLN